MPYEIRILCRRFDAVVGVRIVGGTATSTGATGTSGRPGATRPNPAPADPAREARTEKHQSGPLLPYRLVANWPNLPKGYNFGESSGVDVDKQDNVWVANRGAWPVMEFDQNGKLLQAWNDDTVRLFSGVSLGRPHGIRVDPDGNVWLVDVDGHIIFKFSPEGRLLMTLGSRQGAPNNNDSQVGFNRPTNLWFLPNRHFYVSDGYGNSRVVEFTYDGEYVQHWGRPAPGMASSTCRTT